LLEDDLKTLYRTEMTLKNVLIVFTFLGILIAALGLFGLIYFANTLRKKEIGIRKVLGANNSSLIYLLSKGYILLIVISLGISIPLSNFALNTWLNNFAYRTEVSVWTFIIGIAVTAFIAFVTIFIQGSRAASASPVKNLRTE
jgi:putative ABC transport system permease protein